MSAEYSTVGKGDYREHALEAVMPDGSYTADFIYKDHLIYEGKNKLENMPSARGEKEACETLEIQLYDQVCDVTLTLYYTGFYKSNVITRSSKITNHHENSMAIRKIMSMQLDLPQSDYDLVTFDGLWGRERHKHIKPLSQGRFVVDSKTGVSSNRHNPFIMLKKRDATEHYGDCYASNLIYAGNHYEVAEVSPFGKTRILSGINPHCFDWKLGTNETFQTPEAVLTFSDQGLNGISQNMHHFVSNHIVRGSWAKKERPVLLNNWEATYFDFNEEKLEALIQEAAHAGIELFVLDDGWFGERNGDNSSLGDWFVNTKKLPGGLGGLAKTVNDQGMMFGIWVEPEMINHNSRLYEKHPEWAVQIPNRRPSQGRNQMVLDFTRQDVRDYIVESLVKVFSSANIEYVKWDMNRNFSDMFSLELPRDRQGEFFHRYVLGVYEVLDQITKVFPNILFESCSAGGNRFDLSLLCYMPQTWTSDNTDALQRLYIQSGTSYGYPLSAMGAHVSAVPNHQTLRSTPIETRFNVAMFGVLGYELDLSKLSKGEKQIIKEQIAFYKKHRALLQFGQFYRLDDIFDNNIASWMVVSEDRKKGILGLFQKLTNSSPAIDIIKTVELREDAIYTISNRKQFILADEKQDLIKEGMKPVETECYEAYGDLLNRAGIKLSQQFCASGYNEKIRVMNDFGSRAYIFEQKD